MIPPNLKQQPNNGQDNMRCENVKILNRKLSQSRKEFQSYNEECHSIALIIHLQVLITFSLLNICLLLIQIYIYLPI
jgi:type IV secretory pathway TrbL component